MSFDMDSFDVTPKACPIIEGSPFRWSVGFYRGKRHRVTVAWFLDRSDALDYLKFFRDQYPHLKYDLLEALF